MNLSNVRVPFGFYEPREELVWFLKCEDCGWESRERADPDDVEPRECCPKCRSTGLNLDRDVREV